MLIGAFLYAKIKKGVENMEIVNVSVDKLVPYENNPRNNTEAVQFVANSIKEFGFKVPLVVDNNSIVVCGHTRLLAAKQLGIEEVPCIIADDLTDEQIKAFRLADNKVSEIATWDLSALVDELKDINFLDMEDFGFLGADDLRTDFFDEEEKNDVSDNEAAEEESGKTVKVVCDDANYQQLIDFLDEHLFVYEV